MVRGFSCRKGGRYSVPWSESKEICIELPSRGLNSLPPSPSSLLLLKRENIITCPMMRSWGQGWEWALWFFVRIARFLTKKEWIALFHFLKEWINLFKRVMRAIHSHRLFKRARRAMNLKEQRICFHPQLIWFREKNERFALKKRESLFHKEWITLVLEKWKEWSTHFALVDL